jgi:hypothetical protein
MSYLDYNQSNGYLLPPYLEELISADHVARVVNRVVDLLDIREVTSQEKIEVVQHTIPESSSGQAQDDAENPDLCL